MRQRLDLDALLRKYETNYSPRPQPSQPAFSPRTSNNPRLKLRTETDQPFQPETRYFTAAASRPTEPQRTKVANANFQMSKSECEALLIGLQEELAREEMGLTEFVVQSLQQLLEKFQREHDDLRRELASLLDQSLDQSCRAVLDMLDAHRRQTPQAHAAVSRRIAAASDEMATLLNGLAGSDFKRTIAEVVTRDFSETMRRVREEVAQANAAYRMELAVIEPDRAKLVSVQEALKHLYSWKREPPALKVSDDRDDYMRSSRRSSKRKIFETRGNNKMAMTERVASDSAPKMRRTFFNFDSNG